MGANDHAILVGISRYADESLHALDGPIEDVRLMTEWLTRADGGGLDPGNIHKIVSDLNAPPIEPWNKPPLVADFLREFSTLVSNAHGTEYVRRPGSRLYLYFSGHGFCQKRDRGAHAALYVANASRLMSWNIFGTFFAQWTKDFGLFDEIVLIMDCCRDAELTKDPTRYPLREPTDIAAGQKSKLFEVYAAPRGGKAQERRIPSRRNEIHGLLTHAFLEAIEVAPSAGPSVSSSDIKRYLEDRWNLICGNEPADSPEVILPSNGEISFVRPAPVEVNQVFRLVQLGPGGSFEIVDSKLARVILGTISQDEVTITRVGMPPTTIARTNGTFSLSLPASYYLAVASTPAGLLKRKFQAGEENVEL